MIYTLTMNPAIDLNCSTEYCRPFLVNRTDNIVYSPNGKGINVSLVLKHYGLESKVLGFFGGFSGRYIVDELKKADFEVIPLKIDEVTRINVFINTKDKSEYKFVNKGPNISDDMQNKLLGMLNNFDDITYLIISGSLPPNIKDDYYKYILEICNRRNIKVILDISSKNQPELLKYRPLLIKPNDEEINNIYGIKIDNEEDVKHVLKMLNELGAQNILLTLGEKGLYFYNGEDMYYCNAPSIELLSSACAGDAALASFLSIWLKKKDITLALKRASATGANVAESSGLGDLKKVNEYIDKLTVKKIQ